jgi:hypothetical protein
MKEKFCFDRVYLYNPLTFIGYGLVIGIICIAPYIIAVTFNIHLYWVFNLRLWTGIVVLGCVALANRFLNSNITISFDEIHFYIQINQKELKFLKKEVTGFYSYNYSQERQSAVDFSFHFNNGKKLSFRDANYQPSKFDESKYVMLKNFVQTMEKEFGFKSLLTYRNWFYKRRRRVWYSTNGVKLQ